MKSGSCAMVKTIRSPTNNPHGKTKSINPSLEMHFARPEESIHEFVKNVPDSKYSHVCKSINSVGSWGRVVSGVALLCPTSVRAHQFSEPCTGYEPQYPGKRERRKVIFRYTSVNFAKVIFRYTSVNFAKLTDGYRTPCQLEKRRSTRVRHS